MKNKFLIFCLLIVVALPLSCDFVLKDSVKQVREQPYIITKGSDEIVGEFDNQGCATSAGYHFSEIYQDCIRPFEIGFRLNPITLRVNKAQLEEENDIEQNGLSCFVIISEDKKYAEVFLPNQEKSMLLKHNKKNDSYSFQQWSLYPQQNMSLSYNEEVKFSGAKTVELDISSDLHDDVE